MFSIQRLPQQTQHLYNICPTSAQRLRRCSNIVQMLYKYFVFAGSIILKNNQLHIIIVTYHFYFLLSDPPKVKSGAQRQHVIRVGDAARIPCPVEADSTPLLQWYKDGETINAAWDRFRMGGSALRIRDVIREDAGHYVCKATNGFGSVTVQLAIHVLGKIRYFLSKIAIILYKWRNWKNF